MTYPEYMDCFRYVNIKQRSDFFKLKTVCKVDSMAPAEFKPKVRIGDASLLTQEMEIGDGACAVETKGAALMRRPRSLKCHLKVTSVITDLRSLLCITRHNRLT